jgi:hypothetical protein
MISAPLSIRATASRSKGDVNVNGDLRASASIQVQMVLCLSFGLFISCRFLHEVKRLDSFGTGLEIRLRLAGVKPNAEAIRIMISVCRLAKTNTPWQASC